MSITTTQTLKEKVAIITGGGTGIGQGIAVRLAKEGMYVIISGRRKSHLDATVETIWKSGTAISSDGWTAEMAIPFKSLRFSPSENQVWGINFERYIHRLNEQDYWTDVEGTSLVFTRWES